MILSLELPNSLSDLCNKSFLLFLFIFFLFCQGDEEQIKGHYKEFFRTRGRRNSFFFFAIVLWIIVYLCACVCLFKCNEGSPWLILMLFAMLNSHWDKWKTKGLKGHLNAIETIPNSNNLTTPLVWSFDTFHITHTHTHKYHNIHF